MAGFCFVCHLLASVGAASAPGSLTEERYIDPVVVNTTRCLDMVMRMPLKVYTFKYDSIVGRRQLGVIGPELRKVLPESVKLVPNQPFPNPTKEGPAVLELKNYYAVDNNVLFFHNIGAMQEIGRQISDKAERSELLALRQEIERQIRKEESDRDEQQRQQYKLYASSLAFFGAEGSLAAASGLTYRNACAEDATCHSDGSSGAGKLSAPSIDVQTFLKVRGDASVDGSLEVGGQVNTTFLTAQDNAAILGDLQVAGRAAMFSDVEVGGGVVVTGKLEASAVHVSARASVAGELEVGEKATVGGLEVAGSAHVQGMLTVAGTVSGWGPYVDASDRRLKDGIEQVGSERCLRAALSMRAVKYWMRRQPSKGLKGSREDSKEIGLLAQEVEAVVPEVVYTNPSGYKAIAYARLVPILIEAIKAQQQRIDVLESDVAKAKQLPLSVQKGRKNRQQNDEAFVLATEQATQVAGRGDSSEPPAKSQAEALPAWAKLMQEQLAEQRQMIDLQQKLIVKQQNELNRIRIRTVTAVEVG